MKMKAVCEATGLTDRTIRYYIEENLISPKCTENYLGRKSFDFSDADVAALNDIAVLRKFGFSVSEIREMILHPESIPRITSDLRTRKQSLIHEEHSLLTTLSCLDSAPIHTVSQLAMYLSTPTSKRHLPAEDNRIRLGCECLSFLKKATIFVLVWFPVVQVVYFASVSYSTYIYPMVSHRAIVALLVVLLPTILILLVQKLPLQRKIKQIVTTILLVLTVLITPFRVLAAASIVQCSETTALFAIRRFDPSCRANQDPFFQDLFPYSSVINHTPGQYHYYFEQTVFGDTSDVFLERVLEPDTFHAEVNRVQTLFLDFSSADPAYTKQTAMQNGRFLCHVLYWGNAPFQDITEDYTYYIFAYNEQTRTVRYIYCYSDISADPYYLTLDWE